MHSYYANVFLQELPPTTTTSRGHYPVTWLDSKEQLQEEKEKYRTRHFYVFFVLFLFCYYFMMMICYDFWSGLWVFLYYKL
jgi:hypothetical protein